MSDKDAPTATKGKPVGKTRQRGEGGWYERKDTKTWWITFSVRGNRFREPGGRTEAEAKKALKNRLKQIARGRFCPGEDKLTVDDLLDSYVAALKLKLAKSLASIEAHLKPVRSFFSLDRAVDVGTDQIRRFIESRRAEEKADATVNRSLQAMRAAYRLAWKEERISRVPHFPMLNESNNVRQGFFEGDELRAVIANLPDPINDVTLFAYLTGWRKGEVLSLKWALVDRTEKEVRLQTSKNGRPRILPLDGELWQLVEKRWKARNYETPDGVTHVSEYAFHTQGQLVVDFRKQWAKACKAAKVPGMLFHDLRRTAARDMSRSNVSESVAMEITGHKTTSMFRRYNITTTKDMREALKKTQRHRATMKTKRNVHTFPEASESGSR